MVADHERISARFRRRTSHEPNRTLMREGEQRIFFISIRFGSCEVRRLNYGYALEAILFWYKRPHNRSFKDLPVF